MISIKKAIPNVQKRFCTTILKMEPIFNFLYKYTDLPVKMRIGYRYDEQERVANFSNEFTFQAKSEYQINSNRWIQRWEIITWREGEFPLIDDKIFHNQIQEYWNTKSIDFPEDSNCLNCFWKQEQQIRKNFDTDNAIMQWSKIMEDLAGYTFKDKYSFTQLEKIGLQLDFNFGTGAGCQAGECFG